MSHLPGLALALPLLVVCAAAIRTIWRAPGRAFGILVAGMAFHNVLLMLLLRLDTPGIIVRVLQSWKEGVLVLLLAIAVSRGVTAWRSGWRPRLRGPDWTMAAFALIVLLYFVLPSGLLVAHSSLAQRLLGMRVLLLLPLLYLFGRVFYASRRTDLLWNVWLIVGSAALVGLLGSIELWLVPTRAWLNGGVNQLSAWFGYRYNGPAGLPENFFQSAGAGLYLRRMVSTYVSPLPIAYTGLLLIPLAVGLLLAAPKSGRSRLLRLVTLALVLIGMLFSVTRLALALLVAEFGILALLWRRRWLIGATALTAALVVGVLFAYPRIGPLVSADLQSVHHRGLARIVSASDPSLAEHRASLAFDLQYVIQHPLGAGLGVSIHRFGAPQGTGESAMFDVFGEIGLLGGLLYMLAYGLTLVSGLRGWLRYRDDPLLASIPLVALVGGLVLIPITVTSDVWSDFSVTFLLWWAAGFSVSLASAPATRDRPAG